MPAQFTAVIGCRCVCAVLNIHQHTTVVFTWMCSQKRNGTMYGSKHSNAENVMCRSVWLCVWMSERCDGEHKRCSLCRRRLTIPYSTHVFICYYCRHTKFAAWFRLRTPTQTEPAYAVRRMLCKPCTAWCSQAHADIQMNFNVISKCVWCVCPVRWGRF